MPIITRTMMTPVPLDLLEFLEPEDEDEAAADGTRVIVVALATNSTGVASLGSRQNAFSAARRR
jgi:hypothetical protein